MASNLVIVESPAKAKTIEGYLGKDFVVKSSFGHVRDLPRKGISIDVENDFTPNYEVSEDKKKIVSELRSLAKKANTVWLATDEDREGEAISWHLKETLGLSEEKTKRITFNEITKSAVQGAIESPRDIDINLVNAQQARRVLDRIVGFELSPVLWKKVKPSLSAGRVQSVTVRLIVEREREIEAFTSQSTFKVIGNFTVNGKNFRADLQKNFKSEQEANDFVEKCKSTSFKIRDLQKKPAKRTPAPPFTTSTLQQEASRKLGYSVGNTMSVAQRLYEAGRITYMRTDSLNLSDFAMASAKEEINSSYGNDFCNPRKYKTKSAGAQEAHEAIRPVDFKAHSAGADAQQERLYQLIWKRAIASQMSDAELERTTVHIEIDGVDEEFVAKGEVIKFEGFLKVYLEGSDDENEDDKDGILPQMNIGDKPYCEQITATQRFSRPPARFTEAALVKQLEDRGIGRPSTYAPTISTVQKRGYVEKKEIEGKERQFVQFVVKNGEVTRSVQTETYGADRKKMTPTDIGIVVNDFLVEHFERILDYNFTASVEKEFDDIAGGLIEWTKMIGRFYDPFHSSIEHTLENAERASGERHLGKDAETGEPVIARLGKYGPMVQIGKTDDDGKKARFASLQNGQTLGSISLEEALELFKFPKTLGVHEGSEVVISQGRFGPYVKFHESFVSLPKGEDMGAVDLRRAIELIKEKQQADAPIAEYEGLPVQKGTGRFGPFIKWNEMFINVNRKYDYDNLSQNDIVELIEVKKQKEIDKFIHNWEEEGISVQKARWGRFNVVQGKLKIELPKTFKVEKLTLEDVKKMIEDKKPGKKKSASKKKAVKKK